MANRIIRVIKIGTGSNNKPYARVVVDMEPVEQMAVLKLATELGCSAPPAAFGLLNGVPEDKLALLVPGEDEPDRIIMELVKDIDYRAAGITEHNLDPFLDQAFK